MLPIQQCCNKRQSAEMQNAPTCILHRCDEMRINRYKHKLQYFAKIINMRRCIVQIITMFCRLIIPKQQIIILAKNFRYMVNE